MALTAEDVIPLEAVYPKAVVLHRVIAKLIDFLLIEVLKQFPPVGIYIGITYLLIADGLFQGKSVGKKLVGLQTYIPHKKKQASFKESIIRNVPILIAYLFLFVPFVGWVLFSVVIGFELLLMIGNEKGLRIGDEMAHTQVVDSESFETKNI
ncbi:MAG: RDD family protein [Nitrospiria bacterium]